MDEKKIDVKVTSAEPEPPKYVAPNTREYYLDDRGFVRRADLKRTGTRAEQRERKQDKKRKRKLEAKRRKRNERSTLSRHADGTSKG